MRISFILPTVNMRGGTKVVAIYAKALTARGHEVLLVSPPPKTIPFRRKIKSLISGNGWPVDTRAYPSHLDNSGLNHRVLDRWRPVTNNDVPDGDIVIATWWETAEWVNRLDSLKGAKVYFIQGHEIYPHLPVARCHATYRLPMHKIVISRWLKEVMCKQYADDEVSLVPNSVDRTQFFSPDRGKQTSPTVGFLYSTARLKGLDISLAAIKIIREKISDLRLICFGSEYPNSLLPLPDGTDFFFSPPPNKIRDLYSQCDVWIASSRSEGFYLPAMEAMACRTPVVSTKVGWPDEAIKSGKNGMLFDIDDIEGLARGMEWVLSLSDVAWRSVSLNAYNAAAAGSWEESIDKFESALMHARQRASRGEIAGGSSTINLK